jgi:predicted DNA binding protein
MSGSTATTDETLLYLVVDVWHPGCWTLETTEGSDVGLLGHGTTVDETGAVGWYTAYGPTSEAVESFLDRVEASARTTRVRRLATPTTDRLAAPGATRDLLIEFDPEPTIRPAFAAREFLSYGPTRHEDGRERRSYLTTLDREAVRAALDDIADAHDADVRVARLSPVAAPGGPTGVFEELLTPRQREAFRLAREAGYYAYPRETTTRALAAEMGVSKATFTEHLRRAEGRLLGAVELR